MNIPGYHACLSVLTVTDFCADLHVHKSTAKMQKSSVRKTILLMSAIRSRSLLWHAVGRWTTKDEHETKLSTATNSSSLFQAKPAQSSGEQTQREELVAYALEKPSSVQLATPQHAGVQRLQTIRDRNRNSRNLYFSNCEIKPSTIWACQMRHKNWLAVWYRLQLQRSQCTKW